MNKKLTATILASALTLSACANVSDQQKATATGATAGAIGGGVIATLLGANSGWTAVGALVGAAAGATVAKNSDTGECYYANGDGTYSKGTC